MSQHSHLKIGATSCSLLRQIMLFGAPRRSHMRKKTRNTAIWQFGVPCSAGSGARGTATFKKSTTDSPCLRYLRSFGFRMLMGNKICVSSTALQPPKTVSHSRPPLRFLKKQRTMLCRQALHSRPPTSSGLERPAEGDEKQP